MTTALRAERSFLSIRNGLFEVEIHQAGTGEPLLMLHDMTARRPWAPYLDDLSSDHRVIAPSIPGFRYSTGLDHIDDPVDMAIFLTDLLDALAIDRTAVLGHEIGAMFAAELAAISPGRVTRLVLVSPIGLGDDEADVADIFAMDPADVPALLWADPESEPARDWNAMPSNVAETEEETVLRARAYGSATRFVWPFPERGLRKRVHRITAPALVVWGESDRFVPRELAVAFQRAIPGAQLVTLPGVAHFPMLEDPDAFVRVVRDFTG